MPLVTRFGLSRKPADKPPEHKTYGTSGYFSEYPNNIRCRNDAPTDPSLHSQVMYRGPSLGYLCAECMQKEMAGMSGFDMGDFDYYCGD